VARHPMGRRPPLTRRSNVQRALLWGAPSHKARATSHVAQQRAVRHEVARHIHSPQATSHVA
jgi:hypothetical protein